MVRRAGVLRMLKSGAQEAMRVGPQFLVCKLGPRKRCFGLKDLLSAGREEVTLGREDAVLWVWWMGLVTCSPQREKRKGG